MSFDCINPSENPSELLYSRLGLRQYEGNQPLSSSIHSYRSALLSAVVLAGGVCFTYAAFISNVLPETGNPVIDFIRADQYYCYLVPLTVLPTFVIIYLNWLSMRVFEYS
mmetsp:Transcript_25035/g.36953  ORF Transcript_25035/g.36953 Transcript_25035/m.36953 type:complete len:110 (+) Transcript_25035:18-347(+)